MKTHVVLLPLSLVLAAGCAQQGLKIREIGAVHKDNSDGTTLGRIAIGLGQLSLGNVGLALETFRRAAREDPTSAEALAGMAECYQRMGRPPLARRYLEQALALRPQDAGLYRALAVVADSEGNAAEAAALRTEAALRARGVTATPAQRVTVSLPPPSPAPLSAPAGTVTVALAPPAPAAPARTEGPRLVRMSMGEVMLVSRDDSPFGSVTVASDDTIHAPLRILNAARIEGIAARTRLLLAAKGVRDVQIGNAPGRRLASEFRYATADRERARAIAAKLPFRVLLVEREGPLVLLVGRDAGTTA